MNNVPSDVTRADFPPIRTAGVIRVYRMNDYDWVAARSLEEAKAEYLGTVTVDGPGAFDNPKQLTDEEMLTTMFTDDDGFGMLTFAERLSILVSSNTKFPCMFASTEW